MDTAEVAENILKLHALRAKINMQNLLSHMHLSSRSRDAKVVKKIFGDWVIKESSSMYIKDDASTIYFPLEIEPGQTELITYTYKKEWK